MYRKHINRMDDDRTFMQNCLANHPFHSWDCLTICMQDREVDLVIKDER